MSCATDEVLAAWFAGRVGGGERDALEAHAASCALCRGVMIALSGIGREVPASELQPVVGANALRDATLLKRLVAKNLARVVEIVERDGAVSLEIEPVAGTPLPEWLMRPRTQAMKIQVLVEIGRALNVLHANRLAHGNVVQGAVVVRSNGSAVLTAPKLTGTPAADQTAWWRVVSDVLDRPRGLRATLRRGLAEKTQFANMDRATMALRTALGDRRYAKWLGVGAVGFGAIVIVLAVIGVVVAERKKSTTTIVCAPAAHDWKRMRAPVLAKLAMSGADASAVIARLDERAATTARLQRDTCPQDETFDQHQCLLDNWADITALFPWLNDKAPSIVRDAVDELAFVPRPESCDRRSHSTRKHVGSHAMRSLIVRSTIDEARDMSAAAKYLQSKAAEVEKLDDLDLTAYFHAALGFCYATANDYAAAKPELDLAASDAASVGNDEILLRALTDKIWISNSPDRALIARADLTAKQLNNPALTARLDYFESWKHARAGEYADAISDLRAAKTLFETAALDANSFVAWTDLALGNSLLDAGNADEANESYREAYAVARKRWGDLAPTTFARHAGMK